MTTSLNEAIRTVQNIQDEIRNIPIELLIRFHEKCLLVQECDIKNSLIDALRDWMDKD